MLKLSFVAFPLLIAACPGDRRTDESRNGPAQTSTTTRNPQAVPENSTAMNPVTPPRAADAASAPFQAFLNSDDNLRCETRGRTNTPARKSP